MKRLQRLEKTLTSSFLRRGFLGFIKSTKKSGAYLVALSLGFLILSTTHPQESHTTFCVRLQRSSSRADRKNRHIMIQ
jgi:hypothetical protein